MKSFKKEEKSVSVFVLFLNLILNLRQLYSVGALYRWSLPLFSFPPWPWESFADACKKIATCEVPNLDLNSKKLYLGIWEECNMEKEKFQ